MICSLLQNYDIINHNMTLFLLIIDDNFINNKNIGFYQVALEAANCWYMSV